MTAITLKINGGELELVECKDGRFRWFLGDEDTEVGGATIQEATAAAYAAWPEAEQFNTPASHEAFDVAKAQGFSFFWAWTHTGNVITFAGQSWDDGCFRVNDNGDPTHDCNGNTVAKYKIEELKADHPEHLAQCEEWYG